MNQRNGIQHEDRGYGRNGSDRDRDSHSTRRSGMDDQRTMSPTTRESSRWESEGGQPRGGRSWDGESQSYGQSDRNQGRSYESSGRGNERDDGRLDMGPRSNVDSRNFDSRNDRDFDRSPRRFDAESASYDRDRSERESRGYGRNDSDRYFTQDRDASYWPGNYGPSSYGPNQDYGRDDRGFHGNGAGRDGSRMGMGTSDGMSRTGGVNDGYAYGTQQWNGSRQGSQSYGIGSFDGGYGTRSQEKSGKAPKNYTRSDERVREEVCDALAQSGHDWSDVDVTVSNGEVTLTGTVADRSEKLQAEHFADRVRGVNEVTNQLKIKRADDSASRASSSKDSSSSTADNNGSRRRTS